VGGIQKNSISSTEIQSDKETMEAKHGSAERVTKERCNEFSKIYSTLEERG
jgi:hypothetical protein